MLIDVTRTTKRAKSIIFLVKSLIFLVVVGLGFVVYSHFWPKSTVSSDNSKVTDTSPSPVTTSEDTSTNVNTTPSSTTTPTKTDNTAKLEADLKAIVTQYDDDDIGISYLDLDSGSTIQIDGSKSFTAASTTKILTASYVLQQVQKGNLSLDDKLGSYTVDFQLKQMVNQSNNNSWAYFNNMYSFSTQQAFARSIGINSYIGGQNTLSANDDVLLLKQLYQGKLLNSENTKLLLSYMQNTNEESLLPSGLSGKWTIYHKYGELDDNVHDGGILTDGTNTVIVAVYTNGRGYQYYTTRAKIFTAVTKAIIANQN